ncbi:unnamed protein product [Rangifer tarandus platyrhynchus]|uniref:Uncharacterized protein n=1 Tax=Rangifer tarandus platyrhynchus TaxID=3082113 RepID=A0AC59ZJU1_RANTA
MTRGKTQASAPRPRAQCCAGPTLSGTPGILEGVVAGEEGRPALTWVPSILSTTFTDAVGARGAGRFRSGCRED